MLCHENCAPPPPLPVEEDIESKFSGMDESIGYAEKNWEELWKTEMEALESHLFLSEHQSDGAQAAPLVDTYVTIYDDQGNLLWNDMYIK